MSHILMDLNADDQTLIVHDAIHGSFALPRVAWEVIDTATFQRLRRIKQCGNTYYVYPGAEHTRFQHSLGVAYLALTFGSAIRLKYPELIIDHQVLLLCLAGLCHDLGHCAFSHLYDSEVIPMLGQTDPDAITSHEEASVLLFEKIYLESASLQSQLAYDDVVTISKMILGYGAKMNIGNSDNIPCALRDRLVWTEQDHKYQFLYEVVSNSRTGIDVDKFDYLKRDSHYTGIPCAFDPQRLMSFFSIVSAGGEYHIEYLSKAREMINSMWVARDDLHRRVYDHRVVKCLDLMTVEMIRHCRDIEVSPGCALHQAHCTLDNYCLLTDDYIYELVKRNSSALALFRRIQNRQLWATVAMVVSVQPLELKFSDPDIRVALASFSANAEHSAELIYYIYHTGELQLHPLFFLQLILCAKGARIIVREKTDVVKNLTTKL
jgi:HD superfamily phosphohydrolase